MEPINAGFELRQITVDDQTNEPYFEVHAIAIRLPGALSARKNAAGYWDVWFDIPAINDSPIVARLNDRELNIKEAAELFVQITPFPSWNRYIIHEVTDTEESLDTAFLILFSLLNLLRRAAPRSQTTERIEHEAKNREFASAGVLYQSSRTSKEQDRVLSAFQKLKCLGSRVHEVGTHEFAIHRSLTKGGVSFQGKYDSIDELESEVQRLERAKSGWRSWL